MKTSQKISVLLLAAVFACTALISQAAAEDKIQADKAIKAHKIIRLHYIGGINKEELTIEPGTTVIWVNDARASVEIQFLGKQVTMACKSPVHFIIDENGSFISDRIPQGSVASLCFVEKGEYEYMMRKSIQGGGASGTYRGAIKEFKGKIIVK